MEKIVSEKRLKIASKSRTKGMKIFDVSPGSSVILYREKKKTARGTVSFCFV